CQKAVQQFYLPGGLVKRSFPVWRSCLGINTVQRITQGAVQPAPPNTRSGPLVCPNRLDVSAAEIVHGLGHLGMSLVGAESHNAMGQIAGHVEGRSSAPLGIVEIVGNGSRTTER